MPVFIKNSVFGYKSQIRIIVTNYGQNAGVQAIHYAHHIIHRGINVNGFVRRLANIPD